MSDQELKPCPFCGDQKECNGYGGPPYAIRESHWIEQWQIYCPVCDMRGPKHSLRQNAGRAWNGLAARIKQ